MDRKNLEIISLNASMADHEPQGLEEREVAKQMASQAIAIAYLEDFPEETDLPAFFDEALSYATDLLYRKASGMFHPDDIQQAVAHREDYRKPEDKSWAPKDWASVELVTRLVMTGASLSLEDNAPAFGPHIEANSRAWELLDDPQTKYNKFGQRIDNAR